MYLINEKNKKTSTDFKFTQVKYSPRNHLNPPLHGESLDHESLCTRDQKEMSKKYL